MSLTLPAPNEHPRFDVSFTLPCHAWCLKQVVHHVRAAVVSVMNRYLHRASARRQTASKRSTASSAAKAASLAPLRCAGVELDGLSAKSVDRGSDLQRPSRRAVRVSLEPPSRERQITGGGTSQVSSRAPSSRRPCSGPDLGLVDAVDVAAQSRLAGDQAGALITGNWPSPGPLATSVPHPINAGPRRGSVPLCAGSRSTLNLGVGPGEHPARSCGYPFLTVFVAFVGHEPPLSTGGQLSRAAHRVR